MSAKCAALCLGDNGLTHCDPQKHSHSWASYQIRKIAGCACAGNAGNVFPRRRFQRKPIVSDPGMHHGTCVTHVPWCMSGSLTCGDGENVPGIPGACAPAILRIWQEAHGKDKLWTPLSGNDISLFYSNFSVFHFYESARNWDWFGNGFNAVQAASHYLTNYKSNNLCPDVLQIDNVLTCTINYITWDQKTMM